MEYRWSRWVSGQRYSSLKSALCVVCHERVTVRCKRWCTVVHEFMAYSFVKPMYRPDNCSHSSEQLDHVRGACRPFACATVSAMKGSRECHEVRTIVRRKSRQRTTESHLTPFTTSVWLCVAHRLSRELSGLNIPAGSVVSPLPVTYLCGGVGRRKQAEDGFCTNVAVFRSWTRAPC